MSINGSFMDALFAAPAAPAPVDLGYAAANAAADNAERTHSGWKDMAYSAFTEFARSHPEGFTTEAVRRAHPEIPTPPDTRAWGGVARRAQSAGIIKGVDFVRSTSDGSHGRFVVLWKFIPYQQ